MRERPVLPGRSPEAEVLKNAGFWFASSREAISHKLRLNKLISRGLIGMRRHRRTDGVVTDAYELTDAGLERLQELTNAETAQTARGHREYLRDLARRQKIR